jgi:small subunit ribosomal protein S9
MSNPTPKKIIASAIGRRKVAIASVRLTSGKGNITVNGKPGTTYFPGATSQSRLNLPFKVVDFQKWDAEIRVHGGGYEGQLDAAVLGLARAIVEFKADYKKALRDAGLMLRDPRERQRRMVGMGGKSRRKKQSPKR